MIPYLRMTYIYIYDNWPGNSSDGCDGGSHGNNDGSHGSGGVGGLVNITSCLNTDNVV